MSLDPALTWYVDLMSFDYPLLARRDVHEVQGPHSASFHRVMWVCIVMQADKRKTEAEDD